MQEQNGQAACCETLITIYWYHSLTHIFFITRKTQVEARFDACDFRGRHKTVTARKQEALSSQVNGDSSFSWLRRITRATDIYAFRGSLSRARECASLSIPLVMGSISARGWHSQGRCWEDGGRSGSGWQNIWAYATNVCPRPRHRVIKRQSSFPIMPISLSVRLLSSLPSLHSRPFENYPLRRRRRRCRQPFLGCLRREAEADNADKLCRAKLRTICYVSLSNTFIILIFTCKVTNWRSVRIIFVFFCTYIPITLLSLPRTELYASLTNSSSTA